MHAIAWLMCILLSPTDFHEMPWGRIVCGAETALHNSSENSFVFEFDLCFLFYRRIMFLLGIFLWILEPLLPPQHAPVGEHIIGIRVPHPVAPLAGLIVRPTDLHETIVERQTMADGVLPLGMVRLAIIGVVGHYVGIDFIEGAPLVGGSIDGPWDQGDVREWRLLGGVLVLNQVIVVDGAAAWIDIQSRMQYGSRHGHAWKYVGSSWSSRIHAVCLVISVSLVHHGFHGGWRTGCWRSLILDRSGLRHRCWIESWIKDYKRFSTYVCVLKNENVVYFRADKCLHQVYQSNCYLINNIYILVIEFSDGNAWSHAVLVAQLKLQAILPCRAPLYRYLRLLNKIPMQGIVYCSLNPRALSFAIQTSHGLSKSIEEYALLTWIRHHSSIISMMTVELNWVRDRVRTDDLPAAWFRNISGYSGQLLVPDWCLDCRWW